MAVQKNFNAGELALTRGIYHEAERFLLLAKEEAAAYGPGDSAWGDIHRALAKVYIAMNKLQQAEECALQALSADEGYFGPQCDQVAEDAFLIGEAMRLRWDFERAKPWFERSLDYREQRYGTTHDTTLEVLAKLLILYLQSGQTNGLESIHARAYQAFQATHPSGMWATYLKLHDLAKQYIELGKPKELQDLLHTEANLLRKQVGQKHKEVASILAVEAEVLKGVERKLAAWSVTSQQQRVDRANDLSLFGSIERLYKMPAPQVEEAVSQLLMAPMGGQAPHAVRKARFRVQQKQPGAGLQEPLLATLAYQDSPEASSNAELKLTLRLQPRGPACAATYQWQLFNSSEMALAQTIIAYVVKDIDDNLNIMNPALDLPAGFRTAAPAVSAAHWPTPQQFNEAVQNPSLNFSDEELKASEAELNPLGLPKPYSGAFATVYKLIEHASESPVERAVKCFTTRVPDQQQRYAAISTMLAQLQSSYFVEFEYLPEGIAISGSKYPILKMDWARGDGLFQYVEANLHDKQKLQNLAVRFLKMMIALHDDGIAHGDLQHGNIIISNDEIKLVDYDAMYVPGLAGWKSNELGHRNYQHPQRSADHFNPQLDHFSAWVIYTSLICLSRAPQFWQVLQAGEECLLFRQEDFVDPDRSKAFRLLSGESDPDIKAAIRFFGEIVRMRPDEIPGVADVFSALKN